ncbi:hypothetical protein CLV99_0235 [Sphingobacterium yanglingense]|uniref:Uncharacterized protein n=1 Tax=Sphingobacterium yanglingense TaxID=1437280 RepID=A0A4R6WWC8_9SPHI|nr:hypothetical protein CLV99_0235 [Sphingobacterium yanglingense]
MKDVSLFRLISGIIMVIGSIIYMIFFLRNDKKRKDYSEMLSVSKVRIISTLICVIIFGLFLLFYDFN